LSSSAYSHVHTRLAVLRNEGFLALKNHERIMLLNCFMHKLRLSLSAFYLMIQSFLSMKFRRKYCSAFFIYEMPRKIE